MSRVGQSQEQRVAIVTGGGTGIGAATARKLAVDGYEVVVTGRRAAAIEEVAESIGGRAIVADASRADEARATIDTVLEAFGRLDLLVLNHGVLQSVPFLETTDELWEETLAVNLSGAFYLSRAALPSLIESRGAIVAVASISALQVWPESSAYCASKAGLAMLMRTIAYEHGESVRANTVNPGTVATPMVERDVAELARQQGITSSDEAWLGLTATVPQRRPAQPSEIAEAIAWLGSPAASYVNGATLEVDGGLSIVGA
ncbi:SDR family NAD(P)-dependent oxidoreductase [Salinibacterium sp. ZJ450]|uniref:SDR family NAD(P)-dependent oxidoreductase n=1 Tax=Salinibacterium sp. ZJ450 TaxID=2708338 RepID=UPI0014237628|nr:SDR family NAD(P)-dependent oxidoreductase [Salinibacterium sp. ZJ450]